MKRRNQKSTDSPPSSRNMHSRGLSQSSKVSINSSKDIMNIDKNMTTMNMGNINSLHGYEESESDLQEMNQITLNVRASTSKF